MTQSTKKFKRKDAQKEQPNKIEYKLEKKEVDKSEEIVKPKYGPALSFPYQRIWSRCILILGVMVVVWYNSKNTKEIAFARQKDILLSRSQTVECSENYKSELEQFKKCLPEKCGRVVTDKLISGSEIDVLLKIAERGFKLGGSDGGASILDLHSGAFSMGTGFVNIYDLDGVRKVFNNADFAIYKVVKIKVQHAIAHHFGVDANNIYLTEPTFFSKMTNLNPKTIHDEYWHPHVDKEIYESFHYTSLLYLSDYGRDFEGGRFIFIEKNNVNSTIEPRKGRVSMFTSGRENLHAVERVSSGTRYALTVSFTCDKQFAVADPSFQTKFKKT